MTRLMAMKQALTEAKRFQLRAQAAVFALENPDHPDVRLGVSVAGAKRASMDLSRALTAVRKPEHY